MTEKKNLDNPLDKALTPFEGGLGRGGADIYFNTRRTYITALVSVNFDDNRSRRPRLQKYLEVMSEQYGIGLNNVNIHTVLNRHKK